MGSKKTPEQNVVPCRTGHIQYIAFPKSPGINPDRCHSGSAQDNKTNGPIGSKFIMSVLYFILRRDFVSSRHFKDQLLQIFATHLKKKVYPAHRSTAFVKIIRHATP
jgi:hypothetical protein